MRIEVTKHSVKRYRQRLFDFSSTDDRIRTLLMEIARKGRYVQSKPCYEGQCLEVRYKGVSVVMVRDLDKITIITCLGEDTYRKWVKSQDSYERINGRILHLQVADGNQIL